MSTAARMGRNLSDDERNFPVEAYEAHDDVTPVGVDVMRKKAADKINREEWVIIDGFGLTQAK